MRHFKFAYVIFAIIVLCVAAPAAAEDNFSISMSSKEILYNPASKTATSMVKVILSDANNSYEIIADRAQVDFKTNRIRASGDVYLSFSKRTDDSLPEWGSLAPDFITKILHGSDLLVDMERGEAMLVPIKGVLAYVDLNYSRFIPPVKGLDALPDYEEVPENDVIVCFGMTYSTTGKFMLADATYFAPDGSQYYSARVVSDNPSLDGHRLNVKYFIGSKKRESHAVPPYDSEYVSSVNGKMVWWVNNEPRHSTYLNMTGVYSDRHGFAQMTPELVHQASIANFAVDASVSYDELQRGASVSGTIYTGSRNRYSASYKYGKGDYTDEFDGAEYYDKNNELSASATIWEDRFRVGLSYYASDGESTDQVLSGSWLKGLERYHRSVTLAMELDPFEVPHTPYSFSMFTYASRSRSDTTLLNVTSPTAYTLLDNEDLQSAVVFLPTISAGPVKVFGNSYVMQTVEYMAYRSSVDSTLTMTSSATTFDSSNFTHYSVDTDTKLVVPSYNNINLEIGHNYQKYSGIEEAKGTAGLSYSYNGKDYLFVGEAFDFNNSRWDELLTDVAVRRNGLRLYYSGRYNLLTNDYNSKVLGLVADIDDYTLSVSYEDEDADFRAALYTNYNFGGTFLNIFHKQKETATVK